MSNFHPFEVVDRGSEAQLQLGANIFKITEGLKLLNVIFNYTYLSH